jgi:hypothetical protein
MSTIIEAPKTVHQDLPKRLRNLPQISLEQYLMKKAEKIYEQSKRPEIVRTQISATLQRRFRGATINDQLGIFSPNAGSTDWIDINVSGMRVLNIVKPIVRFNLSTMVTANVSASVEPAGKDPRVKGAAGVAKGVSNYLSTTQWEKDDILEERLSELSQLGYGAGIGVRVNPNKGECVEEAEWGEEDVDLPGEYACKCGAGGVFEGAIEKDNLGLGQTQCPKCGSVAEVTKEPSKFPTELPTGTKQKRTGETETIIASSYELRIDERRSQGGNLDGAKWFEYHYLQARYELERENPDLDFGSPDEWSYPLKWLFELETGTQFSKSKDAQDDNDIFEAREIYLHPDEYCHRIEPTDYKLVIKGEVVFEILAGQKLIEVAPDGLWFKVTGKKLVNIEPDRDFRKEWSYCGFVPDSLSFWMQPLTELSTIQDDVNRFYTLEAQHIERNSIVSLAYNQSVFSSDAFEQDFAPTNSGVDLDRDIGEYFKVIEPGQLREPMAAIGFLIGEALQKIGLVQPAALGERSPGEPYAAQLLQKQSSLGLLAPSQRSKASAKVRWTKNHVRFAQKQPRQWFERIRSRFGEEWKDQDIDAFINCDVDTDLEFGYVEGSEIPTSLIERDVKLQALVGQLVEWAGVLQRPDLVPDELISQLCESAGAEIDLSNTESNQRLAQFRFEMIKEIIEGAGSPPHPDVVREGLQKPNLMVSPEENHKVGIEFWTDHQISLMCEPEINLAMMFCVNEMIQRHKEAVKEAATQDNQDMVESKQPLIQAQQQAAAEGQAQAQQQEQSQQAQQAQIEAAKTEAEDARTAQEQQHEAIQAASDKAHEIVKLEKTHAHEAGVAAMNAVHQRAMVKSQPKGAK